MIQTQYNNFDWLRLLFAAQVVAIHCGLGATVFINPVPAFLAISGFVVMGSIERRPVRQFFVNRALRVLPMLFVSFIAVAVVWDVPAMIKNVLFWLWPFSGEVPANPVVWTLIYEEVFYALLALLFVAGAYKRNATPIALCIAAMLITIFAPKSYIPRQWFVLGAAFFTGNICYIYREQIKRIFNPYAAVAIFAIAIYAVYEMPYTSLVRASVQHIDFISFAAMLIFAIAGPQLPKIKFDLSYSLYLIHCIVLAEISYFIPPGPRLFWFVLLASLPICYACWFLIEKPALSLKTRLGRQASERASTLEQTHRQI